jgi:hypothetical protein
VTCNLGLDKPSLILPQAVHTNDGSVICFPVILAIQIDVALFRVPTMIPTLLGYHHHGMSLPVLDASSPQNVQNGLMGAQVWNTGSSWTPQCPLPQSNAGLTVRTCCVLPRYLPVASMLHISSSVHTPSPSPHLVTDAASQHHSISVSPPSCHFVMMSTLLSHEQRRLCYECIFTLNPKEGAARPRFLWSQADFVGIIPLQRT